MRNACKILERKIGIDGMIIFRFFLKELDRILAQQESVAGSCERHDEWDLRFYSGVIEDSSPLGCNAVLLSKWLVTFQRNLLPSFGPSD